jgi:hypothetical protein
MEGLAAGNPHVLSFALLVIGGPAIAGAIGRAIAVGLKVYAVVPIVGERRWRALLATGILFGASIVIAPQLWQEYLARFGEISTRLTAEAQGGVSFALFLDPAIPGSAVGPGIAPLVSVAILLVPAALVALVAVRDVRAAAWISVPLLWPASQYSNGSFVLPTARRISTWIIAIPTIPTYLVGLLILCYEVAAGRRAIGAEPEPVGLADWLRTLRPRRRPK